MDHSERVKLLAELHRGETSRNREFGRFQEPRARRVLQAHRRLRSLIVEIRRPDTRMTACWSDDGRTLLVECRCPQLRYHHRLTLARWEAEFLLQTPAGTAIAVSATAPT